ncbi:MAG: tol-pal system protein YbgF [Elusimicrobiota bacterium]
MAAPPRKSIWAFCAAMALSGCLATQRDILDLSQQTDGLMLNMHKLKKIMGDLQANQADLNVRLDEMHKDVSILNENLKDNRESMSRLSGKMDDLGAAIGMKVSSLDRSIVKRLDKETEERQRLKQGQQRLEEEVRTQAEAETKRRAEEEARKEAEETRLKAAAESPTPSQLYHTARVQLTRKEYDLAVQGFEVYLQKYPKGEVADLATYYLGQARYSQKRWEDAARQFALVLDRYPKSDLTPAARLRYALSLMKMKAHLDEAKRYLQSIPEDFPRSPEAEKAAEILRAWEAKKAAPTEEAPETPEEDSASPEQASKTTEEKPSGKAQ